MGRAIRTERHRYVEWRENASGALLATELYDHEEDPGETRNLAADPARAATLRQLQGQLQAGWKAAAPAPAS